MAAAGICAVSSAVSGPFMAPETLDSAFASGDGCWPAVTLVLFVLVVWFDRVLASGRLLNRRRYAIPRLGRAS